jgi:hypothetical protein
MGVKTITILVGLLLLKHAFLPHVVCCSFELSLHIHPSLKTIEMDKTMQLMELNVMFIR